LWVSWRRNEPWRDSGDSWILFHFNIYIYIHFLHGVFKLYKVMGGGYHLLWLMRIYVYIYSRIWGLYFASSNDCKYRMRGWVSIIIWIHWGIYGGWMAW
jgi:hypothetical protein